MSFLGLSASTNYSIAALPFYYALTFLPHAYAVRVATQGKIDQWDNRNPRASGLKDNLRQKLGPEGYAAYERAEAAHYNSLESFPLFATAIIVGNLARLSNEELNTFAAGIGILRALYIVVYISTGTQKYSHIRSVVWITSVGWMMRQLYRAGKVLM